MKRRIKAFVIVSTIILSIIAPTITVSAQESPPAWGFGAASTSQAVHIDLSRGTNPAIPPGQGGIAVQGGQSTYRAGQRVGTLRVERLNRTVRVFEGTAMSNMDIGAGRFTFSGLHSGNVALAGHNRGSNGFFSFVRQLRVGDILTFETSQGLRRYAVQSVFTVHETDFSALAYFGDNRLTLVTCVEYVRNQRRIAVAVEVQ